MRAHSPRVSVIIPCYRQAHFLAEAADSVLAQREPDLECVIVNDGSPDDTRGVADTLLRRDPRVRYIEQPNRGLSGARNAGMRAARGRYFQFLDADDRLEPAKLATHADYLDAHPAIGIVFGDARYFQTESPEILRFGPDSTLPDEPWIPRFWNEPGDFLSRLLLRNHFPVNCPLVRMSVFETVGPWNESLQALEDWELWIRCVAAGVHCEYLEADATFALIRLHDSSMTRDTVRMQRALIDLRLAVGPRLRSAAHREKNFLEGIRQIMQQQPENPLSLLWRMAHRNICARVCSDAVALRLFLTFRKLATSPAYQNRVPWPVQRKLGNFFRALGARLLAQ
ncbi:MAG: glycosyltransferase family 2 protein [Gammaproteobacteria bacterium]